MIDVRKDFPQLGCEVNGNRLVYLDSAASTLKALPVINRLHHFNSFEAANVHRGAHHISNHGTQNYEASRLTIANYLNAQSEEIVFTMGTTESINLVASSLEDRFNKGDEIILTHMEHHSNIIPWQVLADKKKLLLKFIPVTEKSELDYEVFDSLISNKTKLVAINHVSNVLGTENDVQRIIKKAQSVGALSLVDAAQSISLCRLDLKKMDCDFLAFSGHKAFGPFGIGVLYGKKELLNNMPPYQTGGSMISTVSELSSEYLDSPQRFEAGTPNVSAAIGLGEAIKYLENLDFEKVKEHEKALLQQAKHELSKTSGFKNFCLSPSCTNILSFAFEGVHPADLGQILDEQGVAVRVGHHCAQLLMKSLGVNATVRASFSVYNTAEDVDLFCKATIKAKELLS